MSPGVWQHICVLRRKATKISPEIQARFFFLIIPSCFWDFSLLLLLTLASCCCPFEEILQHLWLHPHLTVPSCSPGCHIEPPCSPWHSLPVLWMSEGFSCNPVPQHYWNFSTFSLASAFSALWLFSSEKTRSETTVSSWYFTIPVL